jgi:hypothetical protein
MTWGSKFPYDCKFHVQILRLKLHIPASGQQSLEYVVRLSALEVLHRRDSAAGLLLTFHGNLKDVLIHARLTKIRVILLLSFIGNPTAIIIIKSAQKKQRCCLYKISLPITISSQYYPSTLNSYSLPLKM